MADFRALFVGLTTIDIQYFADEFPLPNTKLKLAPPELLVGGPAANAAVAFAKLNGQATLVSAVGENQFAQFISGDLQNTNVKLVDLIPGKKYAPVLATVVTSRVNGDRNIFTHAPQTIVPEISAQQLIETVSPQIILLDGFYPEFGIECAQIAKQKKIPVVLDCGSWKPQYETLADFADFVICSEDFYPQNAVNSQQVFTYFKMKNVPYCAISRGEKPLLFYAGKQFGEIKINQPQIIDTLGAGDVLHGAFCYFLLEGKPFQKALGKASETATFSCRFKGTREWLNFVQ